MLFRATSDCILYMFSKLNKSENFIPGFICVLHTFGRDLKWNPHIHVLLSEGASGNHTVWRPIKHFNYSFLRNSFRMLILNYLENHIGPSFKKTKAYIYKNCPNGFYVYAKPALTDNKQVIKYIGRYLGRPVIATSRIDCYDGDNVTFHYHRHEDNAFVTETVSAGEFIKKLIIHIPDKHFKMIRYYGLYARKHKHRNKLIMVVPKQNRRFLTSLHAWRTSVLLSFGIDPLLCKCGHQMSIMEIYHNGTPLFDNFRKALNSS